jgi:prevent-host-death family protein
MDISINALRSNPQKYFNMAQTLDVTITFHGKPLGRIVPESDGKKAERKNAIAALQRMIKLPKQYSNPDYDPDYEVLREAAYRDRGLI